MENIYLPQNQPELKRNRFKKLAIVGAVLFVFFLIFTWFYSHSFIKISVDTPSDAEIQYELVDQKTKKITSVNTKSSSIKKFVKKGSYEVLVKSKETSFFSVVVTKPLLGTSVVDGSLRPEKARSFVGDNPSPCMYYDQQTLVSYACEGNYGDANAHLPANAESPTITDNDGEDFSNLSLGGFIKINDKKLAYTEGFLDLESTKQESNLLEISQNLGVISNLTLSGLTSEKFHRISKYIDGFLVYDREYSDIKYFSNPASSPETINIEPPKNTELTGQQLSLDGNRIAVAYSNPSRDLEANKPIRGEETTVQVYENGKTKSFSFKGIYYLAQLCGGKYLCMVQDRELEVYDISGEKAQEVIQVGNVYNVKSSEGKLLIIRYDGVFDFDVEKKSGFMQYSLGAYKPCAVETADSKGYVLCLINPKNDKVALYIDPAKGNTDSIDKKVLQLLNLPYVSVVSAYKSFIYISPEVGELEYDNNLKGFAPNPTILKMANEDIDKAIKEIGIDRSTYNIFNTQQ